MRLRCRFNNPYALSVPVLRRQGGEHGYADVRADPHTRLEGQAALAKLFERFPDLRLADPDAPPRWRATPFVRSLERLDLLA